MPTPSHRTQLAKLKIPPLKRLAAHTKTRTGIFERNLPRIEEGVSDGAGVCIMAVGLVGGLSRRKKPRMKRESLPFANRIFLASELKSAYRRFFNAPPGKMLANGFDYQMNRNLNK